MTRTPGMPPSVRVSHPGIPGMLVAEWYRKGHRQLPWRETKDPYRILVSEIMLQQTRVETVIGYYGRFLEAFPDIAALAEADPEQVMNQWKGLGYYSRARNLQKAAQVVVRDFGGLFPETMEGIRSLPGVGPYTLGAIMSIAFGKSVPAVDGNVLRVVARLVCLEGDIASSVVKRDVTVLISGMIPQGHASDFCQGLMELGATVCTPSSPKCASCPVFSCCLAYSAGRQAILPVKRAKPAPVESRQIVCVVRDPAGRILMEYRQKGLLSGLWGLPHYESDQDIPDPEELPERLGFQSIGETSGFLRGIWRLDEEIGLITHTFTHRRWFMHAWAFTFVMGNDCLALPEEYRWVEPVDIHKIPIPEAFQKILRLSGCTKPNQPASKQWKMM